MPKDARPSHTVSSANQASSSERSSTQPRTYAMFRSAPESSTSSTILNDPSLVPDCSTASTPLRPRMTRRSQTPPPTPPSPPFSSVTPSSRSTHRSTAYPFILDREAAERKRLRKVKKQEAKLAWEETCRKEREARNLKEVEEWERKQLEIKEAAAIAAAAAASSAGLASVVNDATTATTVSVCSVDEAVPNSVPVMAPKSHNSEPPPVQVRTAPPSPPPPPIPPDKALVKPIEKVDTRVKIEIEILDSDEEDDSDDEIQIIEPSAKSTVPLRTALPVSRLLPVIGSSSSSASSSSSSSRSWSSLSSGRSSAVGESAVPISRRSTKALFIPPVKKVLKPPAARPMFPSLPKSMRAHLNGDPAEERKKLEDQFEWEKSILAKRETRRKGETEGTKSRLSERPTGGRDR